MKITFKLFATLTDHLPPDARRSNQVELDVASDAPISQIIEPFGLPPKLVHLVLVNGKYIAPEQRLSATLSEGDVLAIWPPLQAVESSATGGRMQAEYPERFERDMGCNEAEWLGWMPRAIGAHPWQRQGASITVQIGAGRLTIHWQTLPERRIALLRVQRLRVCFLFDGLDADQRKAFMKPFDLSMQRGGG